MLLVNSVKASISQTTATPAVTLASSQGAHQLQAGTSRQQGPNHLGSWLPVFSTAATW